MAKNDPAELDVATPGEVPERWNPEWDEPLTVDDDPGYVSGAVSDMTPEQRAQLVEVMDDMEPGQGEAIVARLEARERA